MINQFFFYNPHAIKWTVQILLNIGIILRIIFFTAVIHVVIENGQNLTVTYCDPIRVSTSLKQKFYKSASSFLLLKLYINMYRKKTMLPWLSISLKPRMFNNFSLEYRYR